MLEFKNGFECTDDDCMQCSKYIGDRKYFYEEIKCNSTVYGGL